MKNFEFEEMPPEIKEVQPFQRLELGVRSKYYDKYPMIEFESDDPKLCEAYNIAISRLSRQL